MIVWLLILVTSSYTTTLASFPDQGHCVTIGIQVNAVAPGFIATPMTDKVPPAIRAQFIRKIPLGRIGEPADIADVVAFLASDAARYISGQCIHVDGALSVGVGGAF